MTSTSLTCQGWTGRLDADLAPRELEATLLAAADMTVKEIGRLMGISPRTAENRLESARHELKARTIRGLVVECMRRGLISPAATALAMILVLHGLMADDVALRVRRGSGEKRIETRVAGRRIEQFQVA